MRISISILSIIFILFNGSYYEETAGDQFKTNYKINPLLLTIFKNIRDTVYTLKDHILEINLSTHQATIRSRNGNVLRYPISGGTKNIIRGIETREGLFCSSMEKQEKVFNSIQQYSYVKLDEL